MKTRIFINFLIFGELMFSTCTPAFKASSETEGAPNTDMKPLEVISELEIGQTIAGKCSRSSDEVRLKL